MFLGHFHCPFWLSTDKSRTLLFAPFIPFIVIFCHVIESQNEADLTCLQDFATSIESASSVSEPAAKIQRLFQVLCTIAVDYVKFRHSTMLVGGCQDSSKIYDYLDALGFASTSGGISSLKDHLLTQHDGSDREVEKEGGTTGLDTLNGDLRAMNPMMWTANSAELEEWLGNNHFMTGLI